MLVYNLVPFLSLIRILLTFVSIFSLYSVHLLLKTANEGGMVAFLVFLKQLCLYDFAPRIKYLLHATAFFKL